MTSGAALAGDWTEVTFTAHGGGVVTSHLAREHLQRHYNKPVNVSVHVHGPAMTAQELGAQVRREIIRYGRRNWPRSA